MITEPETEKLISIAGSGLEKLIIKGWERKKGKQKFKAPL